MYEFIVRRHSPTVTMEDFTISTDKLFKLEHMVAHFRTPTGSALSDDYYSYVLPMFSSPDSSGIQEKVLAEACGAIHKGGKKLGDDAVRGDYPLEIKPCKSLATTSSVNITDDQPTRLLKDLDTPNKLVVIGRCPGGIQFRWVVVCPLTDFAEPRYKAMCKQWKHTPETWPASIEDQRKAVERLAEKRTEKGIYLRSSQLKFADIRNVNAFWVHPDLDKTKLTKKAEDDIIRRFSDRQTSVPPMAL